MIQCIKSSHICTDVSNMYNQINHIIIKIKSMQTDGVSKILFLGFEYLETNHQVIEGNKARRAKGILQ